MRETCVDKIGALLSWVWERADAEQTILTLQSNVDTFGGEYEKKSHHGIHSTRFVTMRKGLNTFRDVICGECGHTDAEIAVHSILQFLRRTSRHLVSFGLCGAHGIAAVGGNLHPRSHIHTHKLREWREREREGKARRTKNVFFSNMRSVSLFTMRST